MVLVDLPVAAEAVDHPGPCRSAPIRPCPNTLDSSSRSPMTPASTRSIAIKTAMRLEMPAQAFRAPCRPPAWCVWMRRAVREEATLTGHESADARLQPRHSAQQRKESFWLAPPCPAAASATVPQVPCGCMSGRRGGLAMPMRADLAAQDQRFHRGLDGEALYLGHRPRRRAARGWRGDPWRSRLPSSISRNVPAVPFRKAAAADTAVFPVPITAASPTGLTK